MARYPVACIVALALVVVAAAPAHAGKDLILNTWEEFSVWAEAPGGGDIRTNLIGKVSTKFGIDGTGAPTCVAAESEAPMASASFNTCAAPTVVMTTGASWSWTDAGSGTTLQSRTSDGGTAVFKSYNVDQNMLKLTVNGIFDVCLKVFLEEKDGNPMAVFFLLEGDDLNECDPSEWKTPAYPEELTFDSDPFCDSMAEIAVDKIVATFSDCPASGCTHDTDCPATQPCEVQTCTAGACTPGNAPDGDYCSYTGRCMSGTCQEPPSEVPATLPSGSFTGAFTYTYTVDGNNENRQCIPAASSPMPITTGPSDCMSSPNACSFVSLCPVPVPIADTVATMVSAQKSPEPKDGSDALANVPGMSGRQLPWNMEGGGTIVEEFNMNGLLRLRNCQKDTNGNDQCETFCVLAMDASDGDGPKLGLLFFETEDGSSFDTCDIANYPANPADPSTWNAKCVDGEAYLQGVIASKVQDCADPTDLKCTLGDGILMHNGYLVTTNPAQCNDMSMLGCIETKLPNGQLGYVLGPSRFYGVTETCDGCSTVSCSSMFGDNGGGDGGDGGGGDGGGGGGGADGGAMPTRL